MTEETVLARRDGPIGVITINRPKVLNLFNLQVVMRLEEHLADLEGDAQVRAIIITGAGEAAFVGGADVAELNTRGALRHFFDFAEAVHRVYRAIELGDKPTICAVNGAAVAAGLELLLATDIRIAAEHARFSLPEINVGLFPAGGGSQRLMRQIAPCKARELMFLGDRISAAEALALGLVNKVVGKDELMDTAMTVARRIAEKSPLALKMLKRTMTTGRDMPISSALAHERAMSSLVFDSADAHEGCTAFLEKRAPIFLGR
jgi:enoyl-CoA hydratase